MSLITLEKLNNWKAVFLPEILTLNTNMLAAEPSKSFTSQKRVEFSAINGKELCKSNKITDFFLFPRETICRFL